MPLNPDHETRFARRSSAHWPPLCLGRASSSSAPSRDPLQSPETRRKTRSWPRAIPECEHRGTGWRRGQSRANPSRDDFGQMPADCCTHACDARATMTSWGPSGWLPDLRPAMRIDEATITSVGGRVPPGRKTPRPSAKSHWRGGVPGPTGSSRSARWCRLLRRPTTSRRRAWSTRRGQG